MWPAIIAAGASLAGGILGNSSKQSAQRREYERQKEFAQNGIRWRVADAKAAGLHPLAALGVNTTSYSPQAVVGDDYGLSSMGQDIGRAIEAKQTRDERKAAADLQQDLAWLQVENMRLQNQQLRQEMDMTALQYIDSRNAVKKQQQVPPMPSITGPVMVQDTTSKYSSGAFGKVGVGVQMIPSEQEYMKRPGVGAAQPTELREVLYPNGDTLPLATDETSNMMEGVIGSMQWVLRRLSEPSSKNHFYNPFTGKEVYHPELARIQRAMTKFFSPVEWYDKTQWLLNFLSKTNTEGKLTNWQREQINQVMRDR